MGLYLYESVADAIYSYTGLSPLAFTVIAAVMVIAYKIVSSMFVAAVDYKEVKEMEKIFKRDMTREPVQLGRVSEAHLRAYDGSDPSKPLLMAIKGQIYDVSRGRMYYGPGGPYALFAGRDATRALALMSFDPQDLNGNMEGLSESEMEVLNDWEAKFMEKYPKVGVLTDKGEEENHIDKPIIDAAADDDELVSKKDI